MNARANIIADTPVSLFAQYTPTHIKRTGISKYPAAAIDGIDQVTDVDVAFLDGGPSCVPGGDPYFDATRSELLVRLPVPAFGRSRYSVTVAHRANRRAN